MASTEILSLRADGPSAEISEQVYARIREALGEAPSAEITPLEYWGGGEWRAYGFPSADAQDGVYVTIRRTS